MESYIDVLLLRSDLYKRQSRKTRYYFPHFLEDPLWVEKVREMEKNWASTKAFYSNLLQETISCYQDAGVIHHEQLGRLTLELRKKFTIIIEVLEEGRLETALAFCSIFLREVTSLLENSGESRDLVGQLIEEAIACLDQIVHSKDFNFMALHRFHKAELIRFYQAELIKDYYYAYGDYGFKMLETYSSIAVKTYTLDKCIEFIPTIRESLKAKESLKERGGSLEDSLLQIELKFFALMENIYLNERSDLARLQFMTFKRKKALKLIDQQEFKEAKELMLDTLEKYVEIDSENEWEFKLMLFELGEETQDIPLMREMGRYMALVKEPGNPGFWRRWRKAYSRKEWNIVIDEEIVKLKNSLNTEFEKYTGDYYYQVVYVMLPIYKAANRKQDLFDLLVEVKIIFYIFPYWKYLSKKYCFEDFYPIFTDYFLQVLREDYVLVDYIHVGKWLKKWSDLYPLESDKIHEFIDSVIKLYPDRKKLHKELKNAML